MSSRYAYLACPYSSDKDREQERFEMVTKIAARLQALGMRLYSPITHTHPMHTQAPDDHGEITHAEWLEFDKPFAMGAHSLIVCCFPGWEESVGVRREVAFFERLKRPILYLHSDEFRLMIGG